MSDLDPNFIFQFVNPQLNVDLIRKYERIMSDNKHIFIQETYEEDNREEKRVKVERLINLYLLEYIRKMKAISSERMLTSVEEENITLALNILDIKISEKSRKPKKKHRQILGI